MGLWPQYNEKFVVYIVTCWSVTVYGVCIGNWVY